MKEQNLKMDQCLFFQNGLALTGAGQSSVIPPGSQKVKHTIKPVSVKIVAHREEKKPALLLLENQRVEKKRLHGKCLSHCLRMKESSSASVSVKA